MNQVSVRKNAKKKKSDEPKPPKHQKKSDGAEKSAKSVKKNKPKKKTACLTLFGFFGKDAAKAKKPSEKKKPKVGQSAVTKHQPPTDERSKDEPSKDSGPEEGKEEAKVVEVSPEEKKGTLAFLAQLDKITPEQLSSDFDKINAVAPGASVAEDQLKNSNDPTIPCLEQTAVKTDGGFYHCNKITLEKDDRPWIIAQPPKENAEPFWRLVFDEQVPMILILGPAFEGGKKAYEEFLPEKKTEYKYYGKMFINNKTVDMDGPLTVITLEVLPEGCSNSLITKVLWCVSWNKGDVNQSTACIKILQQLGKLEPGPVIAVSASGTGRSCLMASVSLLEKRIISGTFSNVVDLVVAMRKQRAMAIPDKAHYGAIYTMLGNHFMGKSSDKTKWEAALQKYKDAAVSTTG